MKAKVYISFYEWNDEENDLIEIERFYLNQGKEYLTTDDEVKQLRKRIEEFFQACNCSIGVEYHLTEDDV